MNTTISFSVYVTAKNGTMSAVFQGETMKRLASDTRENAELLAQTIVDAYAGRKELGTLEYDYSHAIEYSNGTTMHVINVCG